MRKRKEKGVTAIQYLILIALGSSIALTTIFVITTPFQQGKKSIKKQTTKAACQIQTGIDKYEADREYNGTEETAPAKLIDESPDGNKIFEKNSTVGSLPVGEQESCAYNSTLEGSCLLNGYNMSLVNHPCDNETIYLEKQDETHWFNYTL